MAADTRNKRTPIQVNRDRAEITHLYCQRFAQHEIAEHLNAGGEREYIVSRNMVQDDLEAIQRQWRKDTARNLDEDKARELARIDTLEREYWLAWERSRQDKVSIATETEPPSAEQVALAECAPDYDKTKLLARVTSKVVSRTEGQVGNAVYLAGVQWCISERCKLLGLYPPTKVAPTDPSGDNPYAMVNDEQLRRDIVKFVAAFAGVGPDTVGTGTGGSALPVDLASEAQPTRP